MNVSLPEALKRWAEERVAEGRYSDYVRDLMRRDQDQEDRRRALQTAIDEGLASGVSEQDPSEYPAELRGGLVGGNADAACN